MSADVMVVVERAFPQTQADLLQAWTEPTRLAAWCESPGWHVETDTVAGEPKLGGRHRHVKVVDADPDNRIITDGVHTEFFSPDVFVSRERITGDAGISPDIPLKLRVEFLKTGRDGTLVRIIQGPYEAAVADEHGKGWKRELGRLQTFLDHDGKVAAR